MKKKVMLSVAAAATITLMNMGAASNVQAASLDCNSTGNKQTINFQQCYKYPNCFVGIQIIGQNMNGCGVNKPAGETDKPSQDNQAGQDSVQKPSEGTGNTQTPSTDAGNTQTPSTGTGDNTNTNEESSTTGEVSAFEQEVLDLTNAEREKYGLQPLTLDTELSKVARVKSEDMAANNYFDHTSPTYGTPFEMMKQFGISYTSAAENIAQGQTTPAQVVQAWMNSQGHRKNILNSSYTHIGIGHAADGNYWTQMFIGK